MENVSKASRLHMFAMWRAIYQAAITPGLQPSGVADKAMEALSELPLRTEIGMAKPEIRDQVDELIRNAYAEGWREAKKRPDQDPPLLEIDWTRPGGVRITELWCVCEIDPDRGLLIGPHHEVHCSRYVNGPARPPESILRQLHAGAVPARLPPPPLP